MKTVLLSAMSLAIVGCSSQNIPQAHKGRMFDKTGAMAFYSGGHGFEGPILPPGTYYTGVYPEIRMVDCSTRTIKEPLTSMTKDGVQFALDVYVTFSANCDEDGAVTLLLQKLAPVGKVEAPAAGDAPDPTETDPELTITSRQVYNTFVRSALGESTRQAISSYDANDIIGHREELYGQITKKLTADLGADPKTALVKIISLNLSNSKLPDEMSNAAVDRATQQVLKDKSIAEQERIKVETATAQMRVAQTRAEAEAEAAKIDVVGAALHRNPEYYVRDVYFYAADKGGSVVLPQDPKVILQMTPGRR
jgi:regulator of protease activity HflC (stomatin/prohibitin superfamily)